MLRRLDALPPPASRQTRYIRYREPEMSQASEAARGLGPLVTGWESRGVTGLATRDIKSPENRGM